MAHSISGMRHSLSAAHLLFIALFPGFVHGSCSITQVFGSTRLNLSAATECCDLVSSQFISISSKEGGGAIRIGPNVFSLSVSDTLFLNCSSNESSGGACYSFSPNFTMVRCCGSYCFSPNNGQFALLHNFSAGTAVVNFTTVFASRPVERGASDNAGGFYLWPNIFLLSQDVNFTACYLTYQASTFCFFSEIGTALCHYLSISDCYGWSILASARTSPVTSIDHSNFFNNSANERGVLCGLYTAMIVRFCVFHSNSGDLYASLPGKETARFTVEDCVFFPARPSSSFSGTNNTVTSNPSLYTIWTVAPWFCSPHQSRSRSPLASASSLAMTPPATPSLGWGPSARFAPSSPRESGRFFASADFGPSLVPPGLISIPQRPSTRFAPSGARESGRFFPSADFGPSLVPLGLISIPEKPSTRFAPSGARKSGRFFPSADFESSIVSPRLDSVPQKPSRPPRGFHRRSLSLPLRSLLLWLWQLQ
jgi:hypothetical protein